MQDYKSLFNPSCDSEKKQISDKSPFFSKKNNRAW